MSVIFTAQYKGERFQVEITRDGDLIFLDHDIEHDIAMAEFGDPETIAVRLSKKWQERPASVICKNLGLSISELAHLTIDWAETLLPVFEKTNRLDARLRNAIIYSRRLIEGKTTKDIADEFALSARDTTFEYFGLKKQIAVAVHEASVVAALAYSLTQKLSPFDESSHIRRLRLSAIKASIAAGNVGGTVQRHWQIRRFVDCMEAVQAGKPWPPLEATR